MAPSARSSCFFTLALIAAFASDPARADILSLTNPLGALSLNLGDSLTVNSSLPSTLKTPSLSTAPNLSGSIQLGPSTTLAVPSKSIGAVRQEVRPFQTDTSGPSVIADQFRYAVPPVESRENFDVRYSTSPDRFYSPAIGGWAVPVR